MKSRILVLVVGMGLSIASGALVFAEETQGMENDSAPAQNQGEGQGMMMGGGGQGMKHKMMGMMPQDSLVATSDGGVVLKSGPRLLKYDKDLILVNEVEIPRGKKPAHDEEQKTALVATETSVSTSTE
ncbi:MAG: hypothetical protein EXS63_00055 [Candidatus Omnitrophica bacterium]|nr:hypothetical protein [Candidatus Omnitrophota bacterium]